jgi:hypothetical protein
VVSPEESTVLVTVTGGGVDVEVSVAVMIVTVETVATIFEVSTGGAYPM